MTSHILQEKSTQQAEARAIFWKKFTVEGFGIGMVVGAILIAIIGNVRDYNMLSMGNMFMDFYANVSAELLSVVITVLIVDRLTRKRLDGQELTRLKTLLESNENVVARSAIAELKAKGWLQDGSLEGVSLSIANLEGADLADANLQGGRLVLAKLQKADLWNVNLQGANLVLANLQKAFLSNANLEGADLRDASLEGAVLWAANLKGAFLSNANLEGAVLWAANLKGADLRDANLEGAHLEETKLDRTFFEVFNSLWANLVEPNLEWANLVDANRQRAVLIGARFDENTILPDGSNWTPDTVMSRFTNPDHSEFWKPDVWT